MASAGETRSADPFLGQRIDGRFKVEAFLGAGTVGSVYRAHDLVKGGQVALKIWNGAALNDQTRGRFEREALALSTLHHPNIVEVQSFGTVAQLPYVAMEYLDGQPLEAFLKDGQPLAANVAYDVITQILQALAYAHGLGVVHRDLKPDNVVLLTGGAQQQPRVKLLDFGLAKFLSPDDDPVKGAALTMLGMVMGTPLYMAPEQGAGRTVDARVDVYAAGCVLFEMLAGRPPFLGDSNAEIFRAHMLTPVPRLAELRSDVRVVAGLQALLERALAKDPEQRFAHAGQMLEALAALPTPLLRMPSLPGAAPEPLDEELPAPRKADWPRLLLALITGVSTAAALAYALLY